MDEPLELRDSRHWRVAVSALRAGYGCLAVGIGGLVLLLLGTTPWLLASGVIGWLLCAAVTMTGLVRARRDLPLPRPGFWPTRWMIISDSVRPRPKPRPEA